MKSKPRVGIIGGMGPLAGVELHRLIIEATPATFDQDHIDVLLHTNSSIPDRTVSLARDNGQHYAAVVGKSAHLLEKAGVDFIAVACMTAHTRLDIIRQHANVPILNGIKLVQASLRENYSGKKIALLATNGSIQSRVFTKNSFAIDWVIPEGDNQHSIMKTIYAIKAGKDLRQCAADLQAIISCLEADVFVLGCTELGLVFKDLEGSGFQVVDPLRVLAHEIVRKATDSVTFTTRRKSYQYT